MYLAFIIIALSVVDRWIRTSITSESFSQARELGIGSFFDWPKHLQPLFWFLSHSLFLDTAAGTIIVIVLIQTILWMRAHDKRALAGLAIVLAGANNCFDRWIYGGVWDYWIVRFPWGAFWFNIADMMIIAGVIYLFTNVLGKNKINKSIN